MSIDVNIILAFILGMLVGVGGTIMIAYGVGVLADARLKERKYR